MKELETIQNIVDESLRLDLFSNLIKQLNKDLALANIDLNFNDDVTPTRLLVILQESIYRLIQEQFIDYLNLLYIIDISEELVKQQDGSDALMLSKNVTYLVLKRVWKKVWYKYYYN